MISDAYVLATCDREDCVASVAVQLDFVYRTMSERSGYYDHTEASVCRKLEREEWVCKNDKHYCSTECGSLRSCAGR